MRTKLSDTKTFSVQSYRALIAALIVLTVLCGVLTYLLFRKNPDPNAILAPSSDYEGLSEYEAKRVLNQLYEKVQVTTLPAIKENVDLEKVDLAEILPDINKFPLLVAPVKNTFSVEIASSPEKASPLGPRSKANRWLVDMAEKFNRQKIFLKGQQVSVSVRSLPSGLAMDYIISQKYIPDAFTPSNSLWGDALKAQGHSYKLMGEKLVGNVAGIVIEKSKYAGFLAKYKEVSVPTVVQAVNQGNFTLGYTNPVISSTGANFMMSLLYHESPNDPLSEEAKAAYEKFQNNIPFVAFTTLQMTEAAKSGVFDGFIYEYQQFLNSPELKENYVFTPFGIRHDSPVYVLNNLDKTKLELVTMFITFCRFPEAQKLAKNYGFNQFESYAGRPTLKGRYLPEAQKLFLEKKTGDRAVVAVFVADISGSMAGAPLRSLKRSLIHGSKEISYNNYIGLVQFSDQVQIALPIGRFDLNQRAFFTGAVNNMTSGGGTAMYDGIIVAAKMLEDIQSDLPDAIPMIIVLSDGETVEGHTFEQVAPVIRGLRIPIYTIGYNADLKNLRAVSSINEAASLEADTEDIVYKLRGFFNAEM
ncbi:MAG: VWA domain-containing protein [Deltaproteobacteria bacterium]|jgi:Ca-activated chloride channel family protein|nr:VWA domain-containing protein [Deltaproteobacteria bacterium]